MCRKWPNIRHYSLNCSMRLGSILRQIIPAYSTVKGTFVSLTNGSNWVWWWPLSYHTITNLTYEVQEVGFHKWSSLVQLSSDIFCSESNNSGASSLLVSWFSINMLLGWAGMRKTNERKRWDKYWMACTENIIVRKLLAMLKHENEVASKGQKLITIFAMDECSSQ